MKAAKRAAISALLLSVVTPAAAHRLDEYLQATILAVEKESVKADLFLSPGINVLPAVLAAIDTDGDGAFSPAEQRAYAERVIGDWTLTLDGARLRPRVLAVEFPPLAELRQGLGEIHFEIAADLPRAGSQRSLRLENRHQAAIATYQVNCLLPPDPGIRLGPQRRNETQSIYELDYTQAGPVGESTPRIALWIAAALGAGAAGVWLAVRGAANR